jgi:hypothetical protein
LSTEAPGIVCLVERALCIWPRLLLFLRNFLLLLLNRFLDRTSTTLGCDRLEPCLVQQFPFLAWATLMNGLTTK